ncbi:hypothetical protein [Alicyclobacillus mengziensis]|uniref:hypothetical protein n=1 Tax=Alicyclobacillus mengziensis TaxID=2931921 RepID=UPI0020118F3B|nr:hypothetical protein [Alicyclobacillus mengziensis]
MAKPIISQQAHSGLIPFPLIPRQWEQYIDVPFVLPALTFPWDIFDGIEQEYYLHLYDSLRRERVKRLNKAGNADDSVLGIELPTRTRHVDDTPVARRSRSGRNPHDFMPMMRAFELARLLYVEMMAGRQQRMYLGRNWWLPLIPGADRTNRAMYVKLIWLTATGYLIALLDTRWS